MPDTNKEMIRAAKTGDLEKVGTTPLHTPPRMRIRLQSRKMLIERGADLNAQDMNGKTVTSHYVFKGNGAPKAPNMGRRR